LEEKYRNIYEFKKLWKNLKTHLINTINDDDRGEEGLYIANEWLHHPLHEYGEDHTYKKKFTKLIQKKILKYYEKFLPYVDI
jgi:hypothetical protein